MSNIKGEQLGQAVEETQNFVVLEESPTDDITGIDTDITAEEKHRYRKQPFTQIKHNLQQNDDGDVIHEQARPVFTTVARRNNMVDADEIFGQNVTASLHNISDTRCKEFLKVKIQELIFQAQFGLLPMPFQQGNGEPGQATQSQSLHDSTIQRDTYHSNSGPGRSQEAGNSNSNDNNVSCSGVY